MKHTICIITAALLAIFSSRAQEFGKYRPLYFAAGVPVSGPIDKSTAGFKFQFGTSIPLAKGIGGRDGFDLDFVYNQISTWDFFDESSPFRDHAFMPGLFLAIPLKGDRVVLGVEHRSNGRPLRRSENDASSRSVTYGFVRYEALFENGFVLKADLRAGNGWYDDEPTQDVYRCFLGYGDLVLGYRKERFEVAVTMTPVFGPFHLDLKAETAYRLGVCSLFVQFCDGHEDAQCDWIRGYRPQPYLRAGVLFGRLL